jgi:aminomethyltransferase
VSGEQAMTALRTAVAVTRMKHVHALRLEGPGAADLLDAACTSRLFIREQQLLQTLLLDAGGRPFADAFIGLDEDSWLLFAEGPERAALLDHLARVRPETAEVTTTDLLEAHELWSLDGPFAWELASALLGPEVLGAPYLSFLKLRDILCVRAGKTGEYGYLLLVPKPKAEETWKRLHELGAAVALAEADLAALDQCALENWHYSIRLCAECPLELQLRWRIDPQKRFEGSEALRARLKAGLERRLTCFTAKGRIEKGQAVELDGSRIGEVAAAGFSSTRGDWVGWALLDAELAWPGIAKFRCGEVAITTMSPPLIDNRSLFVDPRKHTYRTREEHAFPPLVTR